MSPIFLLDSAKLSQLLKDALSWKDSTASLMVSATNGSILAYAFKNQIPDIKALRTMSTTMTAAYTIASEDILVFEAQLTRAMSVIMPVGDHVLLAVSGPERAPSPPTGHEQVNGTGALDDDAAEASSEEQAEPVQPYEEDQEQETLRRNLEEVAESLAAVLREELAGFTWPGNI